MTPLGPPHALPPRLARLRCVRLADGVPVALATSWRARLLGLAGLREPPPAGLLLSRCRAVHTVGMRFPLTLVWLDAGDRIVRVDRGVPPGRLRMCGRARTVLELPAGQPVRLLDAEPVEQALVGPPVPVDAD